MRQYMLPEQGPLPTALSCQSPVLLQKWLAQGSQWSIIYSFSELIHFY